jgi:hypothetical protein
MEVTTAATTGAAATGVRPGTPRSRLIYAAVAVSSMTAGVTLVASVNAGIWQLVVFAVLPDVAILAGLGRGLARGQLHPRAVPLYNTLHRWFGPAALAAAAPLMGPAWLIAALGWTFHICFDHAVGLGLRTREGFVRGKAPVLPPTLPQGRPAAAMTTTPGPTGRQLVAELGDVLHDLPAFVSAPAYRRLHQRWGATRAEIAKELPGDEFLPRAQFRATRAITIDAPPAAVWPWLVQVGCLRAGWYSNDLLDNLAHPSATTIMPVLQHLEIGQWVPMAPSPTPSDLTAFKVHSFDVNRWLLWSKPDSTWAWQLTPIGNHGTRLVTRVHASRDWRHPLSALLSVLLMEFGDFAMQRRMLRGIKTRAETFARETQP